MVLRKKALVLGLLICGAITSGVSQASCWSCWCCGSDEVQDFSNQATEASPAGSPVNINPPGFIPPALPVVVVSSVVRSLSPHDRASSTDSQVENPWEAIIARKQMEILYAADRPVNDVLPSAAAAVAAPATPEQLMPTERRSSRRSALNASRVLGASAASSASNERSAKLQAAMAKEAALTFPEFAGAEQDVAVGNQGSFGETVRSASGVEVCVSGHHHHFAGLADVRVLRPCNFRPNMQ